MSAEATRPCTGWGGGFCAAGSDPWECTEAGRGRAGHLRVGVSAWGQRCCDGAFPKACDKAPPAVTLLPPRWEMDRPPPL